MLCLKSFVVCHVCSIATAQAEGAAQAHADNKFLWGQLENLFLALLACPWLDLSSKFSYTSCGQLGSCSPARSIAKSFRLANWQGPSTVLPNVGTFLTTNDGTFPQTPPEFFLHQGVEHHHFAYCVWSRNSVDWAEVVEKPKGLFDAKPWDGVQGSGFCFFSFSFLLATRSFTVRKWLWNSPAQTNTTFRHPVLWKFNGPGIATFRPRGLVTPDLWHLEVSAWWVLFGVSTTLEPGAKLLSWRVGFGTGGIWNSFSARLEASAAMFRGFRNSEGRGDSINLWVWQRVGEFDSWPFAYDFLTK